MLADDRIVFTDYRFTWASVHPDGVLERADIRDADPAEWPPEVRTTRGETLFFDTSRAEELAAFCARTGVPVVKRPPIWADLLEEFLDTVFPPEQVLATYSRLAAAGVPRAEVDAIRERLRPLMHAYNLDSGLWDWVHLGQNDLLRAASGVLVPAALPAALGDLDEFYRWTMAIADRSGGPGQATAGRGALQP